jgi:hypothetical protein
VQRATVTHTRGGRACEAILRAAIALGLARNVDAPRSSRGAVAAAARRLSAGAGARVGLPERKSVKPLGRGGAGRLTASHAS